MYKTSLAILFCLTLAAPVWAKGPAPLIIQLTPASCKVAVKVVPDGHIPDPAAVAKDAYCAAQLMKHKAPRGTMTIFGSARTPENHDNYKLTRDFAFRWTQKFGTIYPVLTGGGQGIMEAGNRGAFDAKGQSLSISTVFTGGVERANRYTTAGYVAASFTQREADLVDYAAAIVVAPGGFGTEWEIFESLSKIQTKKKRAVPVVMLGGKAQWQEFLQRVNAMRSMGTISPDDDKLFHIAETVDEALNYLEQALQLAKPALRGSQANTLQGG